MTNEEAINNLDAIGNILGDWFPGETSEPFKESLCMGMVALDKQIPKKIGVQREDGYDFDEYYCPNCHGYFEDFLPEYDDCPSFCRGCGQALDWSEVEE